MPKRATKHPVHAATHLELELVIRDTQQSDLPLLEWYGMYTPHRQIFVDTFSRAQRGEVIMLVAVANEFPVGQVWVDLTKPGREGVGLLWALRVYPFMNGLGIGRMLMEAAEAELARRGYHTVELGVEQHAGVHAFYQRLGYTAVRDEVDVVRYTHPDGHEVTDMFDLRIYAKSLPQPARSATAVAS